MIIAVNINRALAKGDPVIHATEKAWALKLENCEKHKYVIGVVNGVIKGYFNRNNVQPDKKFPKRVAFELTPCTNEEKQKIDKYILTNNVNLKGIQRGKYIW
jgi:hypothetical protein